jgi:Fic family protein
MRYNWQQRDWPNFTYNLQGLEDVLFEITERMGRATGLIKALPEKLQDEALIEFMVSEALKTSEIEGEYLSRKDVISSIRNNLGFNHPPEKVGDKRVEGIAELMIEVRNTFADPMTETMLFNWHEMLMKGSRRIIIGRWREHEEPMQVVSGGIGKEKVHFEAPPSAKVPTEMKQFVNWFNHSSPAGEKPIKRAAVRSAIAHLYFESIHPFDDGNGRIGRAISEKALSQGIGRPVLLSLSRTIESKKNDYYDALQQAQKSNEITPWLDYFLGTVLEAQKQAEEQIEFTLRKSKFFDRYNHELNARQLRVLRRMLEKGEDGFEGGMSAQKYMKIAKISKATATRDLQDLVEKEALEPIGAGRSTRYKVKMESNSY